MTVVDYHYSLTVDVLVFNIELMDVDETLPMGEHANTTPVWIVLLRIELPGVSIRN